jgi:BirA family transcriptional regulator, biotin operon repressor / biotin---[acetyl-CoA-carboxylase] ligase
LADDTALPLDDLAAAIEGARSRSPLALTVRHLASTTSTMDQASLAVAAGDAEGCVVIADEQSAGRGRRGHTWQSPPGAGLYLSIVLRPSTDAASGRIASLITLAAGVGVRGAIGRASGLWADLKWPNDLLAGGRKVAGILAEGHGIGTDAAAIVVGVGVNVGQAVLDPLLADRATSIEAELGRIVPRGPLLEELLVSLAEVYLRLRGGEADAILREWREAAPSAAGTMVEWESGGVIRNGITAGVDRDGALLIRTAGAVERVIGGEVRWR